MRAAVLGGGSWGTALSLVLARNGNEVVLWGRNSAEAEAIRVHRENRKYLPGFELPASVEVTTQPPTTCDMWVIAVPSAAVREVCALLPQDPGPVVLAAKGLEPGSGKRMTQVLAEERPGTSGLILSGPNLAIEIARGVPSATVIAGRDLDLADWARARFMDPTFRVYTNPDVVGVELGGALKNVLAVGAGMSDGLGFGDNTKAALLSRGLREMATIGMELGAEMATFMGLSGFGDLFATAVSSLSRNYRVGRLLAQGSTLDAALREIGQVAEGVPTSEAAVRLAQEARVEAPLHEAIHAVLCGELRPQDAVRSLMERTPRVEI